MKKTIATLFALSSVAMGETSLLTADDASYSIYNVTSSTATLDLSSDTKAYTDMTLTFKLKADAFLTELYSSGQNHTNATLASVATTTTNLGMAIRFNSSSNTKSSIYAVYSSNSAASGANGMSNGFGPATWTATLNGSNISSTSAFTDMLDTWGYNSLTQESNVSEMLCSFVYGAGDTGGQCYFTVVMDNGDCYEFTGSTTKFNNTDYKFTYSDVTNLSVNSNLVSDALMFDSCLTNSDVISVHSSMMIPEPTTATLSLLALAGLAARRRRK
ncbi:MAG: PEP-CTERM sorting domain-containing protein [Akkermansia sp.]|nr:PEP-CTERM sorting domain-containing protein [Akkermansia sp.]